jgi:hypothetical protein
LDFRQLEVRLRGALFRPRLVLVGASETALGFHLLKRRQLLVGIGGRNGA